MDSLKVCLLFLIYSTLSMAQNKDSASLYSKNHLRFGLSVGYGAAKIQKDYYKPLVRPTFSVMLHQPISSKSQLLYKAMYRSFGYIYPSGSFNGIGYKGYTQLDFAGLSSTYLYTVG